MGLYIAALEEILLPDGYTPPSDFDTVVSEGSLERTLVEEVTLGSITDAVWNLSPLLSEAMVIDPDFQSSTWYKPNQEITETQIVDPEDLDVIVTLFLRRELNATLQYTRVFTSQTLTYKITSPIFMVKNFNGSALVLTYNIWNTVFAPRESLRFNLSPAQHAPVFTRQRVVYSLFDENHLTSVLQIEYKVLLDGIDVTHLIRDCTISYGMENFAADINITWAHSSLTQTAGDHSLYETVACPDVRTNYLMERLEVYSRVVSNEVPVWTLQGKFFIEKRGTTVTYDSIVPTTWGRNQTARLAFPAATPLVREWADNTTAFAIASELCAAANVNLSWEIADFRVLGSNVAVDGVAPIDVIAMLAAVLGGVLTCRKDGTLRVIYRYFTT